MSVELNELRDSVRQVVDGHEGYGAAAPFWSQCVELGWLMVGIPEELDGLGMGDAAATAVHLELGRGLSGAPAMTTMLAIDAVCNSFLDDKAGWISTLISGNAATATLAESGVSITDGKLSGTLQAALCADIASHALVWTQDRKTLVLLDLSQTGIDRQPRKTWDETRSLFDVDIRGITLAEQTVLATGEAAVKQINRLLALRDYALAADAIGAATALLAMTVEHLNTRVQFRRPLAMFQALKHRCADMKTAIAASEAMLLDALNNTEPMTKAAAAKQLACQNFMNTAEDCLQLHGGIGMADEHPCHLFLKRALLNQQLGDSESYEHRIAEQFLSTL